MSEDFDKRSQEVNKQMRGDFDGRFEFDYFPEIEKVFRRYRYNGCDSKCEAYLADGVTHFAQLKGHKLQSAEKIWWDCRNYIWKEE